MARLTKLDGMLALDHRQWIVHLAGGTGKKAKEKNSLGSM